MYNLRYNIASLVAVFLALAVGLLLGTVVAERGTLDTQKNDIVTELNKTFTSLRQENSALRSQNDALTALVKEVEPRLATNALVGRTVLIVADPDSSDAVARASDAVRLAGGTPAVATFGSSGLSLGDAATRNAAQKVLGHVRASLLATGVIDTLSHEWMTADTPRTLTQAMISAGGLRLEGLSATATVSGAVAAAVFNGTPDATALALARELSGIGSLGAGVEVTAQSTGLARAARADGLSAVDDVDTPIGELSLVWVLAGRASGWYGVQPGADAPYPTPLFPSQ